MRKLILFAFLFFAAPLRAHDFWLEPSAFRPPVGSRVAIGFRQGESFLGDPVQRDPSRIDRFIVRDSDGEREVGGMAGLDPAGYFEVRRAGLLIVGYQTRAKLNNPMEAEKFEKYLRDEGLERIVDYRARRGESRKAGTEMFARSAKSLLYTGSGKGAHATRPLGFRFEIVPETDPSTVRLLFEGKPVEGALVFAIHRDDPSARVQVRSDRKGRAALQLPKRGVWLIKSLHMIPAPPDSGVEWESIWASLTFEK